MELIITRAQEQHPDLLRLSGCIHRKSCSAGQPMWRIRNCEMFSQLHDCLEENAGNDNFMQSMIAAHVQGVLDSFNQYPQRANSGQIILSAPVIYLLVYHDLLFVVTDALLELSSAFTL